MNARLLCAALAVTIAAGIPTSLATLAAAQDKAAAGEKQEPKAAEPAASTSASAAESLQKAVQNPVASLISFPFQNNTGFNIGAYDRTQDVLNIQPVIPVNISKNWMVITRLIQPVIWQPYAGQNAGGEYGLGDLTPSFYLSPRNAGKLIWGAGPVFTIPTATNNILGQGKLSMGPAVVLLTQPGHWTLGALINNQWSVAGSGSRPAVNQMVLQWFIARQLKKGWYVSTSPIVTADWRASSGNVWTVPFGGGFGRVMKVGFQPINWQVQFFGNAVHPAGASPWGMRVQIQLLFPKLTKEQTKLMMEEKLKQLEQETPKK